MRTANAINVKYRISTPNIKKLVASEVTTNSPSAIRPCIASQSLSDCRTMYTTYKITVNHYKKEPSRQSEPF